LRRIAVLIPCYNEAQTIQKVVDDYKAVLPQADIYVYDNNSTDNTAEIAHRGGQLYIVSIVKVRAMLFVRCFVILKQSAI